MLQSSFSFLSLGFLSLCLLILSCTEREESSPVVAVQIDSGELSPDSIQAKGLLSVAELYALLQKPEDFVLFEVSKKTEYDKGHLKNARHVWRPDYENKTDYTYSGMCASRGQMQDFLSAKGVSPQDKIILYDVKGACDALRLAWILKMYGHANVQVLNGGKKAWQKAGYPLSTDVVSDKKITDYRFPDTLNESSLATFEDVREAMQKSEILLVDTREQEEFSGQPYISKGKLHKWKKGAATYGCIPSAVHLNWSDAVDLKGDHRFKCLKDLKHNFMQAGITPDKDIIVYCQSGVRSAHTAYVLSEILGFPKVRNYDGSWIEWSHRYVEQQDVQIERHTDEAAYEKLLTQLEKTLSE